MIIQWQSVALVFMLKMIEQQHDLIKTKIQPRTPVIVLLYFRSIHVFQKILRFRELREFHSKMSVLCLDATVFPGNVRPVKCTHVTSLRSSYSSHLAINFNYFQFSRHFAYGLMCHLLDQSNIKKIFFHFYEWIYREIKLQPFCQKFVTQFSISTCTLFFFVDDGEASEIFYATTTTNKEQAERIFMLTASVHKDPFRSKPFRFHNLRDYKIITESTRRKHSNIKDSKACALFPFFFFFFYFIFSATKKSEPMHELEN